MNIWALRVLLYYLQLTRLRDAELKINVQLLDLAFYA